MNYGESSPNHWRREEELQPRSTHALSICGALLVGPRVTKRREPTVYSTAEPTDRPISSCPRRVGAPPTDGWRDGLGITQVRTASTAKLYRCPVHLHSPLYTLQLGSCRGLPTPWPSFISSNTYYDPPARSSYLVWYTNNQGRSRQNRLCGWMICVFSWQDVDSS